MKYNKTLALIPALLLAACGGDEQSVNENTTPGSVIYSYPADGQADVSPKADIVLRFSHAIVDDEATLLDKIQLDSAEGTPNFTVTKVDGGKSLKLEIADGQKLASKAGYSVTFSEPLAAAEGRTISTPNAIDDDGIQFNTRAEFSGIAELANTSDTFGVAWQVPESGSAFKAMNFSTFRLAMTQPVHPDWQKQGGSIQLLDKNGEPVPATILVKGNRITIDPCVTEDPVQCGSKADILNAGETYTLKLSNLASLTNGPDGKRFSKDFSFTPRDTGPTVVLQQSAVDSNNGSIVSVLNGQAINSVTLNSVLQGVAGPSQQAGDLFAELAFAPAFEADEALPLRIPKGSVLTSTSLDVLVGGKVPILDAATGQLQTTGDIKVTMLSDASGYMSPNPYTDDISAPRHITLFMDVSMNTEEAQPNAALSQDLMGVELRGIALVQNGVLTIDAIGMVEPNLLGQEYTDSTIAFNLEAATDIDSALDAEMLRELDSTPPQLVSWMPGDKENAIPKTRQSMQRPGDPVILFFDEPLAPSSIAEGVSLYADGLELAVGDGLNAELDGTALTLNPDGGLRPGVNYTVSAFGVTDLAGNTATIEQLDFKLDGEDTPADAPPLALTTYPGFPCETNHDQLDLEAGILGECYTADGSGGDILPVSKMPEDRPITVVFSQPMNLDSIRLSETFIVQKVDSGGNDVEEVAGRLEKNNQRIRFFPNKAWEPGKFYQYTMVAYRGSDEARVDPSCQKEKPDSVCGVNDFPLKADLLEGLDDGRGKGNAAYQPLKIYFEGSKTQNSVFTPLRNLPIRDTNANLSIGCGSNDDPNCLEPFDHEGSDSAGWAPSANATKLLVDPDHSDDARVGCATGGSDCPKNKFIYQTYALNTEVTGPKTDPETGKEGIGVLLYPTLLATTSIDVHLSLLSAISTTGPQILRMRYAKEDPNCTGASCVRNRLIPGIIVEDDNGQPIFKTNAELVLDAPDLSAKLGAIPLPLTHNLHNYPFTLELVGNVTFFDDGRMQIEQRNQNRPEINVAAKAAGLISVDIPLFIPEQGAYLNFISNPVKDLPAEQ
ncbi:Ig-like domain-containing protein [Marinobacter sp. AC-23]|uniref:Ig-like domain-containing protein n=1 Tax=Marinobacter sp. AC-23 TaxID=1879031 RepID=UPI0008DC689C|nr:Ig-like domain-containing protein [Marinobacter sp. AC-23]OHY80349.1 hypothetical protein BCA33_14325 [Marinobacter sp. AC-23]